MAKTTESEGQLLMFIEFKNENGTFIINGNSSAKLLSVSGLGLPSKLFNVVSYEGQPGQTTLSETDQSRTITMSFDFDGDKKAAERLYKILYNPVDICFISGNVRRKTKGRVSDMEDLQNVILGQMWNAAIQFICDNPYFEDLADTSTAVYGRTNNLPNYYNDDVPKIQLPVVATTRFTEKDILNSGDIDLYPVISVTNNGTAASGNVIITNMTTMHALKLNYAIPAGNTVVFDVFDRKVYSKGGQSLLSFLDNDTLLKDFKLIQGKNNIVVSESTTTNAQLQCVISFRNIFLTAVI